MREGVFRRLRGPCHLGVPPEPSGSPPTRCCTSIVFRLPLVCSALRAGNFVSGTLSSLGYPGPVGGASTGSRTCPSALHPALGPWVLGHSSPPALPDLPPPGVPSQAAPDPDPRANPRPPPPSTPLWPYSAWKFGACPTPAASFRVLGSSFRQRWGSSPVLVVFPGAWGYSHILPLEVASPSLALGQMADGHTGVTFWHPNGHLRFVEGVVQGGGSCVHVCWGNLIVWSGEKETSTPFHPSLFTRVSSHG